MISFFSSFGKALRSLKRNLSVTLASVATVAATILIFGVFLMVVVAMAIGYIFQRKSISGSCGGLCTIGIEKECDCPEPCDNRKKKMAKEEARRKMLVDNRII